MATVASDFRFFGSCLLAPLTAILLALRRNTEAGLRGALFSDFSVAIMNLLTTPGSEFEFRGFGCSHESDSSSGIQDLYKRKETGESQKVPMLHDDGTNYEPLSFTAQYRKPLYSQTQMFAFRMVPVLLGFGFLENQP